MGPFDRLNDSKEVPKVVLTAQVTEVHGHARNLLSMLKTYSP
jgi:hypothetical protein